MLFFFPNSFIILFYEVDVSDGRDTEREFCLTVLVRYREIPHTDNVHTNEYVNAKENSQRYTYALNPYEIGQP